MVMDFPARRGGGAFYDGDRRISKPEDFRDHHYQRIQAAVGRYRLPFAVCTAGYGAHALL